MGTQVTNEEVQSRAKKSYLEQIKEKEVRLKKIKLVITAISIVGIIFTRSNINWQNILSNRIDFVILKDIVYDLSIGVFSAMVLIWIIDGISERDRKREERQRLKVLYRKMIPPIKAYYEFYLKLYVATRKEKVVEGEKVLQSLFNDKEEFVKRVKEAEPFYQQGFYGDGNIDIVAYMQQYNQEPPSLPWYKCWNIDNKEFFDAMKKIEQDFGYLFPTELFDILDRLLNTIAPINNIASFIERTGLYNSYLPEGQFILPIEFFMEANKFDEILNLLEKLMIHIQNENGEDILSINIKDINDRNVTPILGSATKRQAEVTSPN